MAQFERLYAAQYCAAHWPEGGYQLGFPLGPIPQYLIEQLGYEGAANYYRPWRPEVDAVKFFDNGILMMEFKVFRVLDGMAKLRWYGELAASTEELRPWFGQEVNLRLVTPRSTDVLEGLVKVSGVQLDIYETPEVIAHAKQYDKYWTAEYQRARQLEKERFRSMGIIK